MYGGLGDDSFEVRSSGARVYEFAGEGTDTVFSRADDYTLGANVEILRLIGNSVSRDAQIGRGNDSDNILYANQSGSVLIGGAGNDIMIGGAGDDRYQVTEAGDLVYEAAGQGTDTVDSYIDTYQMSLNVEILRLAGQGRVGLGSAGNDTLIGNELGNTLNGNAGNDVLTGGGGADQFWHLAGGGLDRITDFDPGAGEFVVLSSSQFADYAAVQAAMTQSGANVVITFSASQTLTLENVTIGQLSATNFGFHQDAGSAAFEGAEKSVEPLVMGPADDDSTVVTGAEAGVHEDSIPSWSGEADVGGPAHFGAGVSMPDPQSLLPEAWPQRGLMDHLWL
jgi:serralysin